MLIDSHCHLDRVDLRRHDGDFQCLMQACTEAGLARMLCVSIDLEHYPAMRRLVDAYPSVDVSVGVHPNEHEGAEPSIEDLLRLASDPRVVAIGETGLDYARGEEGAFKQRERFRLHIQAARGCSKPLIVHTRAAAADTLALLKQGNAGEVGGVFHCFTEDWETARQALELGFHLSFSGIITFKNAAQIREVARRVPLDRLLIETDSPYLAPVPYRGKPNEPLYLQYVAACVAEIRGLDPAHLARVTHDNYVRLFNPA